MAEAAWTPQGGPAKDVMLRRIRSALADHPPPVQVPRAYQVEPGEALQDHRLMVERFVDRVRDYRATIHRAQPDAIDHAVARALRGARRVVVPHDLSRSWLPAQLEVVIDDLHDAPISVAELDAVDAVVTGAAVGVAETGTVVLDGGSGQGRRAVTLVPDIHVCVIGVDQIVATVPQAVRALDATRPQTWISGPSATSDIELDRVEGVHGPRTLHVVVVG